MKRGLIVFCLAALLITAISGSALSQFTPATAGSDQAPEIPLAADDAPIGSEPSRTLTSEADPAAPSEDEMFVQDDETVELVIQDQGPIGRSIVSTLPTLVGLETAEVLGAYDLVSETDPGVGVVGVRTASGLRVDLIVEIDGTFNLMHFGVNFRESSANGIQLATRDNGRNLQVIGVTAAGRLANILVYYNDGPTEDRVSLTSSPFDQSRVEEWVVAILSAQR